ncbi:MAG: glycine betaine ABC transporter substrate-binding protein [Geodermatophilaceae bacterium]
MNLLHTPRVAGVAGALTAALVLAGCGSSAGSSSGAPEAGEDSVASGVDLSGVQITIGSKEYTEQLVLGSIMVQALRAAGADVVDQTGLTGTKVARAALESGEIDAYYEYTGTAWLTILQNTEPIPDPEKLFEAVRTAEAENDISWFSLASFNDTYALVAGPDAAKRTGVTTISEYAALANEDPQAARLCASAEFTTREDGLPGLEAAYGFDLPASELVRTEQAISLTALAQDKLCNFSYATSTDASIESFHLTLLEDDKSFFPIYNPAVSMRTEIYNANQDAFDKLFDAISAELTQETITRLNAEVEIDGVPVEIVAERFLTDSGII